MQVFCCFFNQVARVQLQWKNYSYPHPWRKDIGLVAEVAAWLQTDVVKYSSSATRGASKTCAHQYCVPPISLRSSRINSAAFWFESRRRQLVFSTTAVSSGSFWARLRSFCIDKLCSFDDLSAQFHAKLRCLRRILRMCNPDPIHVVFQWDSERAGTCKCQVEYQNDPYDGCLLEICCTTGIEPYSMPDLYLLTVCSLDGPCSLLVRHSQTASIDPWEWAQVHWCQ